MGLFFGFVLRKSGAGLLAFVGAGIVYLLLAIVFAGHFIFCMGIHSGNFNTMLLGRFINGIGSESVIVGLIYVTKLFILEENLVVMNSLIFIASRLFYSLSYYVNPEIYIQTQDFDYIIY